MNNFFNFFKKEDNKPESFDLYENKKFQYELKEVISKCNVDKQETVSDIENMNKWAKEVILEIFEVPHKYWYKEIVNYQKIKDEDINKGVSTNLILNTDKVILGYIEQIKIKQTKLLFYDALLSEYERINAKLNDAFSKIEQLKKDEEQMIMLNKHKKKIQNMSNSKENMDDIYKQAEELNLLTEDIKTINQEFIFRKEMSDKVLELEKDVINEAESANIETLNNEVNELIAKFKSTKNDNEK